jgi:hypothetical protein
MGVGLSDAEAFDGKGLVTVEGSFAGVLVGMAPGCMPPGISKIIGTHSVRGVCKNNVELISGCVNHPDERVSIDQSVGGGVEGTPDSLGECGILVRLLFSAEDFEGIVNRLRGLNVGIVKVLREDKFPASGFLIHPFFRPANFKGNVGDGRGREARVGRLGVAELGELGHRHRAFLPRKILTADVLVEFGLHSLQGGEFPERVVREHSVGDELGAARELSPEVVKVLDGAEPSLPRDKDKGGSLLTEDRRVQEPDRLDRICEFVKLRGIEVPALAVVRDADLGDGDKANRHGMKKGPKPLPSD